MKEKENKPLIDTSPKLIEVIERISLEEKHLLDIAKHQKELGLSAAETAVAQGRLAEANHRNIILQFALKYHLNDGDLINEDGTITRKKI